MEDQNVKRKRGRPRADIDLKMLEALCEWGATDHELAAHFNVSEKTIENYRKDAGIKSIMNRGFAHGNISLRRKQFQTAMAGNVTMQIWLGKQRLGQKDKIANEISGKLDRLPAPKIYVNFVKPNEKPEDK